MTVLIRVDVLDDARPLFVLLGVETEERSCVAAKHATEGEERGCGGPLALVGGTTPVWLCWAVSVWFLLARLSEQLTYQCLEIPWVS